MGFSRQEYLSRLLCFPSGDLPTHDSNSRMLRLLHWQAGSLLLVLPKDLQFIILSEISQTEKDKYHMKSHMCNLKQNLQNRLTDVKNKLLVTKGKRCKGGIMDSPGEQILRPFSQGKTLGTIE